VTFHTNLIFFLRLFIIDKQEEIKRKKRRRVEEDILRILRLRIKLWLRKPSKIAITAIKSLLRKLYKVSLERLYSASNQKRKS